jgi:hypothetical protein
MPDIVDMGMKLGLSGTTLLFFFLFMWEQRRHDNTRAKYSEHEKERREKDRDLARERIALDRERIEADRDSTKVITELVTLLRMGGSNK